MSLSFQESVDLHSASGVRIGGEGAKASGTFMTKTRMDLELSTQLTRATSSTS